MFTAAIAWGTWRLNSWLRRRRRAPAYSLYLLADQNHAYLTCLLMHHGKKRFISATGGRASGLSGLLRR